MKTLDADGIIFRDVGRLKAQALRLGIPAVVVGHDSKEVRGIINVVTDSSTIGRMDVPKIAPSIKGMNLDFSALIPVRPSRQMVRR